MRECGVCVNVAEVIIAALGGGGDHAAEVEARVASAGAVERETTAAIAHADSRTLQ